MMFSTPSFSYWEVLSESSNSINYYFKKNSYKTLFGESIVTELSDLKHPQIVRICRGGCGEDGPSEESYLSTQSEWEYDCGKDRFQLLKVQYYTGHMGQGVMIDQSKFKSDWLKGIPQNYRLLFCGK